MWHNQPFLGLSHLEVSIKQLFAGVTWQWLPTGGRVRVGLSFWLITQVLLVIHGSPSLTFWGIVRTTYIYKHKKLVRGKTHDTWCFSWIMQFYGLSGRTRAENKFQQTSLEWRTVTRNLDNFALYCLRFLVIVKQFLLQNIITTC